MGCKGSKLDHQEAVVLCRGRADLLAAALRHRYALADSHHALAESIASAAAALNHLLLLPLPLPLPMELEPAASSSHINFAPSSDSDSDSPSASDFAPSHINAAAYGYAPEPPYAAYPPPPSLRLYYARTRPPPPSVSVEHRAPDPDRLYYGRLYHSYAAEPPSPPTTSSWDFFNVFDVYDNYCYDAAYTPGRTSREVREDEGIPELEEEDDAVLKHQLPADSASAARSSIAELDDSKEVIGGGNAARHQPPTPVNVAAEIKAQFLRAADAVKALSPLLEVGRRSYNHRTSVYHVSSRMVSAIALPHSDPGVDLLDAGGDKVLGARSLSFTLNKLYIWEKKLHDEVKAEEKMRLLLAKNAKRLKFLDQKGAEAQKIDTTRNMVRKLSTKLRISVRVIAKVSKKINRVRDEELWPQINALIQGFVRMWRDKLDCYQIQCQVISEAKNLDSVVPDGSSRDLALELELELMKWIVNFSSWVNEQRSFVKALNGWLSLCLSYKAEDTVDGVPPYSPGRVGAPLVFVICNSWSQAMDRFSEKEVVTSMQALVSSVRKLSEKQNVEQMEQIIATRERERWSKILERKTVEINKEADVLNRKLALVPGRHSRVPSAQTYQDHLLDASSLQACLQRVVQALESFASNSLQAFEQTLRHAEEERSSRENAKDS
ncbi:unnamed protein product [Urochloa humidicola]